MEAISPVLPSSPQFEEHVLAKDQPQYKPLPVVVIQYAGGEVSMISSYKLTWRERVQLLLHGRFWLEQLTGGNLLQPQQPHVFEPKFEVKK